MKVLNEESILQLSSMNTDELRSMGENTKEYVIRNYSYENLTKMYKDIL